MKIEVDEMYCCDQEMKRKGVRHVDSKKESIIYVCPHCNNSFEISEEIIKVPTKTKKLTS